MKINWFRGLVVLKDGTVQYLDLTKPKDEQVIQQIPEDKLEKLPQR